MSRNTLLIAIAAIVVVGIAVGVLISGVGQNGKLSGSIGPTPTSINLSVSGCSPPDYAGLVSFAVTGYLLDAGGGPVANRTVNLVSIGCTDGGACFSGVESLVTRSDGSFSVKKRGAPSVNATPGTGDHYRASFAGDAQYGASSSGDVYRTC